MIAEYSPLPVVPWRADFGSKEGVDQSRLAETGFTCAIASVHVIL